MSMDFVGYSELSPLLILVSFGLIGTIFSILGSIGKFLVGGSGATTASSEKIDYRQILQEQKEEFSKQMALQAQESKRQINILLMGGGALVVLIVIFFVFMKKMR